MMSSGVPINIVYSCTVNIKGDTLKYCCYYAYFVFPFLTSRHSQPVEFFVEQVEVAKSIPVQIPYISVVRDAIKSACLWEEKSRGVQDSDKHPHYDGLKRLLQTGRDIPVKLELLAQLESRHAAAKAWMDRATRTFIKKNSGQDLMEVWFMGALMLFPAC